MKDVGQKTDVIKFVFYKDHWHQCERRTGDTGTRGYLGGCCGLSDEEVKRV